MKSVIASLIAVAGMSAGANAQLMKMLVSTDGINFSSSVNAAPGSTVQCLVTVSYTGTATSVAGFGSANFQPIVSNWHGTDALLPLRQGGNTLPPGGGGVIQNQFYSGSTASADQPNQSAPGPDVVGGTYAPGTYGRVSPMGRTFLDGANLIQGFVHNNPDGSGQTYLRIAQANVPMWIGQPGNTSGGSGVNVAQLYVVGRTSSDPDFWGNRDVLNADDTDPTAGLAVSNRIAANDVRRVNVEVFRFAMTLDATTALRDLTVDAPLGGQQEVSAGGARYIGYWSSATASNPNVLPLPVVQTGVIHVIPTPASLALLGLGGLVIGRRRR